MAGAALAGAVIEPYRSSSLEFAAAVDGAASGVAPLLDEASPLVVFASSVLSGDWFVAGVFKESGVTVGGATGGLLGTVCGALASVAEGSDGKSGIFGISGKLSDSGATAVDKLDGGPALLCDSKLAEPAASGGGTALGLLASAV
jgi:hypothetical protein